MTAEWGKLDINELVLATGGRLCLGIGSGTVAGVETDTRKLEARKLEAGKPEIGKTPSGLIFWALEGENFDGHDFILQALEKGAAGVLVSKEETIKDLRSEGIAAILVEDTLKALGDFAGWWRRNHDVKLAAITGSVGKTTTKEMTAGIFELNGPTLKNQGNFNNLIGLPQTLLGLEKIHARAVLEMGMNRLGEIGRLTEIADPDAGLITKIGEAHLEGLGTIEGVAKAKTELIGKIDMDSKVILNGDDDLLIETARSFSREAMTFGLREGNDIRAENIKDQGIKGLTFDLVFQGKTSPVELRVPGFQNIYNALAAASIAVSMDEDWDSIPEGLKNYRGLKGRFNMNALDNGVCLIDDTYNANPTSLKSALGILKGLVPNGGRIFVGLGEMLELGSETVRAHREAGERVAQAGAYYFAALGDHAEEMVKGAIDGGLPAEDAVIVQSHEEMAETMMDRMRAGDLIFLKGSRMAGLDKVVNVFQTETSMGGVK